MKLTKLILNKESLALTLIVILAIFLRFFQLGCFPVSLTIDEVGIGYNAYSIWHTARDEFGTLLPLAFRSVGDFKPPVLIYLMAPSVAFFGLNEFGVRFPVALVGSLTVVVVYLITKQLTKSIKLSVFTALLVAISPWHINFSRSSFEAIIALFFVLLGVYYFLKHVQSSGNWLWISGIFFTLSAYTYHTERLFSPIFLGMLIILYRDKIFTHRRGLVTFLVSSTILALPLFIMMLNPQGQKRAKMTFIAQDENIAYDLHPHSQPLTLSQKIFDSNTVMLVNFWAKRYLNYWDSSFLFFSGMHYTHPGNPNIGIMYLFEMPLLLYGLYLVFFKDEIKDNRIRWLLGLWLLIGPFAASLTNNEQHPLRSLPTIPAPHIVSAIGLGGLLKIINRWKIPIRLVSLGFIATIFIFSTIYWMDMYFVHFPVHYSEYFDYGMKQASQYAWQHYQEYDQIIVDPVFGTEGPYITGTPHLYMLFYGRYNPSISQSERRNFTENFGKFQFRKTYWPSDQNLKNTLFIASPWSINPKDVKPENILQTIYFKNGQPAFLIVKT